MDKSTWNQHLKPYATANWKKASWQLVNTLVPYIGLQLLFFYGIHMGVSYGWLLLLVVPNALFMVRAFILFHDCTHMSFFKSKRANDFWGYLLGIVTFTPYDTWQKEHNRHHGTVGNLDKRGIGDVWTMTVSEYQASSRMKQKIYQLYRNPLFLFGVAPFFLFLVLNRFPRRKMSAGELRGYIVTNVGLAAVFALSWLYAAPWSFFMVELPTLFVASVMGVWLFFVQHQFEEVYWAENESWDIVKAALEGSSFYKLPRVLDWFTGSIGYHHIHHLNSRIPNYHLRACYKDFEALQAQKAITLLESFKLALLHLYDEQSKRMISFRGFKRIQMVK